MATFDAHSHPYAKKEQLPRHLEPGLESLLGPMKPVQQSAPGQVFTFERKPIKLVESLEKDKDITF